MVCNRSSAKRCCEPRQNESIVRTLATRAPHIFNVKAHEGSRGNRSLYRHRRNSSGVEIDRAPRGACDHQMASSGLGRWTPFGSCCASRIGLGLGRPYWPQLVANVRMVWGRFLGSHPFDAGVSAPNGYCPKWQNSRVASSRRTVHMGLLHRPHGRRSRVRSAKCVGPGACALTGRPRGDGRRPRLASNVRLHMPPVPPFLQFAIVWNDEDLQEVVISASSGLFSGQVNLYAGWNELKEIAERLRGFPSNRDDKREFTIGQDNLSGYGTASLRLYCVNSRGHVAVEVTLHTNPANSSDGKESAVVIVPAVVGDIDRLAADLRSISNQVGASAVLRSAA